MPKKLIIHCGAHKTATSSLQYFFSTNDNWLLEEGVRYLEPASLNESRIPQLLRGELEASPENIVSSAEKFSSLTDETNVDTFLISHESFFSYAGNLTKGPIYPTLKRGLSTLNQLGLNLETRFLFCVREPADFARSVFLQNLGIVYSGSFEQFFDEIKFKHLDWLPTLQALSENAALGETRFFPYEVLKARGSKAFLQLVLSMIGIHKGPPGPLPFINTSLPREAARKIQSMGSELMQLPDEERRRVRREVEAESRKTKASRESELTTEMKRLVSKRLKKSNEELFRVFMPEFDPSLWD
ncbi:MAG: hypothetical protein ACJZ7Z_01850 [Myxococcota bacterium]